MTIAAELAALLSDGVTGNQTELAGLLRKKGFKTTQSSVSRALKKINAIKGSDDKGKTVYSFHGKNQDIREKGILQSIVTRILDNGNLIVVHTLPGMANTVAKVMDDRDFSEILGTLAGDDTILMIPSDLTQVKKTVQIITTYLKNIGVY